MAYQMQYLLIAEESLLQSPCTKRFVHVRRVIQQALNLCHCLYDLRQGSAAIEQTAHELRSMLHADTGYKKH